MRLRWIESKVRRVIEFFLSLSIANAMVGNVRIAKTQNRITIASLEYEVTAKMKTIPVLSWRNTVTRNTALQTRNGSRSQRSVVFISCSLTPRPIQVSTLPLILFWKTELRVSDCVVWMARMSSGRSNSRRCRCRVLATSDQLVPSPHRSWR